MVEDQLREGRLMEPFSRRIEASESFYLVHDTGTKLHPDALAFATWLVAQAHRYQ
ncbi:hypothetical protein D9M71_738340 [compost metagenome]